MVADRKDRPRKSGRRGFLAGLVPLCAAAAAVMAIAACETATSRVRMPVAMPDAEYIGVEACAMCHEDRAGSLAGSRHGSTADARSPMATRGCESCHGPGSVHAENRALGDDIDPAHPDIVTFGLDGVLPGAQQSAQCMECHRRDHREWGRSPHEADGCAACHRVHGNSNDHLLRVADVADACTSCHRDVRAEFDLISHHPVPEGRMTCADCHDPHGSSPRDGSARRLNDACFRCHSGIRGPWTFEHAAVREGCTTCHRPHGSVARRLLTEPDFNLCLRCHYQAEFYQAVGHYSHRRATNQPFLGPQYSSCVDCHRAIHGSNFSKEFRLP